MSTIYYVDAQDNESFLEFFGSNSGEFYLILPEVDLITLGIVSFGSLIPDAAFIFRGFDGLTMTVEGSVSAAGNAIVFDFNYINSLAARFNHCIVGVDGVVRSLIPSHAAFADYGSGTIIRNLGRIEGPNYSIYFGASGLETNASKVINQGLISGQTDAISGLAGLTRGVVIENRGEITSLLDAIDLEDHAGIITLRNKGLIEGNVRLGTAGDTYDGRGGAVEGTIFGNAGNDMFRPGLEEETIDGGIGNDTLNFRGARSVTVSLYNDRPNSDKAEGDTFLNIENIIGSRAGDSITGAENANTLFGGFGGDSLSAGGGNDQLWGDWGSDTLTGGSGNDSFVWSTPGEAGDIITDFSATGSNNDFLQVKASNFGLTATGPLAPNAFITRADNVAQDADDRFIFRTTDRTLWSDVDGAGGAGPVLLATFQGSTAVTAGDIFGF